MMTDEEIKEKLQLYFKLDQAGNISIENGLVSCTGTLFLMRRQKVTELPVQFKRVGQSFWCQHNKLTTLAGAPESVHGDFVCNGNQLTSLAGAPRYVGKDFWLTYAKNLALLPLLKIQSCQRILFFNAYNNIEHESLSEILNRYLGKGTRGMLSCAMEMIKAGYGSNARL